MMDSIRLDNRGHTAFLRRPSFLFHGRNSGRRPKQTKTKEKKEERNPFRVRASVCVCGDLNFTSQRLQKKKKKREKKNRGDVMKDKMEKLG